MCGGVRGCRREGGRRESGGGGGRGSTLGNLLKSVVLSEGLTLFYRILVEMQNSSGTVRTKRQAVQVCGGVEGGGWRQAGGGGLLKEMD